MITMKQRNKSYRVAQRDAGMRAACKIKVRSLTSDYSALSASYPERTGELKGAWKKEFQPVLSTGDEALFVVQKHKNTELTALKVSRLMAIGLPERGED